MDARASRRPAWRRGLLIVMVLVLVASACSGDDDGGADPDPESDTDPESTPDDTGEAEADDADGAESSAPTRGPLTLRLSHGVPDVQETDPPEPVDGDPLDDAAIDAVVDRLPEWTEPADDRVGFNRPAESLPPPRTGATTDVPFPADGDDPPPPVPSGPLEVVRFQPEGEIAVAPSLSVTFNQPMVPLATLEQLGEIDVPVSITPDLPGRWQWIGTKTLRFEHESEVIDRLPMATTYTVEVPAGTESETGGVLAETVTWQFETPPVSVNSLWPTHDSLPLEPLFFASFDQRIEQEAVLDAISLVAGDETRDVRLATSNEIDGDPEIREIVDRQLDDRWLVFRAVEAFSPDTRIDITVGPGVPSLEGPNTSEASQSFDARTYAPLAVEEHGCRSIDRCEPGSSLWVRFNNELDVDAFDPALVEISPELPGAFVFAQGSAVEIRGATAGRTTYEVTYDASLADTFGQTLGADETVTFEIGPARTRLERFRQPLLTLDPLADSPTIGVGTTNHDQIRVRVFAADPTTDWPAFRDWEETGVVDLPEIASTTVDVDEVPDELVETSIDLSPYLDDGLGQLVVLVEPTGQLSNLSPNDDRYWENRPTAAWVQSTEIGLDIFGDQSEVRAWTTALATGEPLADVEVRLVGTQLAASSASNGLAVVDRPEEGATGIILATLGDDVAFEPGGPLRSFPGRDTALAHVFDDRGIYRPEETAHVKGWVRRLTTSGAAELELFGEAAQLAYVARDWFGNDIGSGSVDLNALGGFDLDIDIPAGANLGPASVVFTLEGAGLEAEFHHSFQIEEFRRPEFEVTARTETPGPYLVNEPATVAVEAEYFSGGGLPNADVEWVVTTRTAQYSPPNWDDFTFGVWVPWWHLDSGFGRGGRGDGSGPFGFEEPAIVESFSGVTDAQGRHFLQMEFGGDGEGQPTTVTSEATVFDVNRQAWSSSTDVLVHPGEHYVGLRSDRAFVRRGDPLVIEAIVTDIDGEVVVDRPLVVEASRLEWRYVDGEWIEEAVESETCEITSGSEPVSCTFVTETGGKYLVTSEAVDEAGRRSRTELTRWVSGGTRVPARDVEQEEATLIPDRPEYSPGTTAEILVESPFSPAEGLLTITRNGFVSTERFSVDDFTAVLEIPVEDGHVPNLHVRVDLVGATARTADDGTPLPDVVDRPAFATGYLLLDVPPTTRTLDVTAQPAAPSVEPGVDTSVEVTVRDDAGAPVEGAEFAVVVVDEAVLALTGYELRDPLDTFYGPVDSQLYTRYAREKIVLTDPEELENFTGAPTTTTVPGRDRLQEDSLDDADMAADESATTRAAVGLTGDGLDSFNFYSAQGQAAPVPVDVRTNFDALAVYAPEVATGPDGTATIDVPLPDNLTRYRVMVVAADGADRFGTAESNITARLPLMVRPSPPRFLNFGDTFELPVVVQNQTDDDMEVDLAVQTSNLVLTDGAGRRVTVPANDRVEVRFPAATDSAGTARFRVAGVSGDAADAATVELPVYTPATTEAFATYGVVDDGAVRQPLLAPDGVYEQFGGLEVNTSSTAVQALTDAVLYLHDYPYLSADGYASRLLAVAALRDVLAAFDAEGLPAPAELERNVDADIEGLLALQNGDGGFAHWQQGRPSYPFVSIQATHALVMARDNGFTVPEQPLAEALWYVRNVETHIPSTYSQRTKDTLSAYALHVRMVAGDPDPEKAQALYDRAGDELGLDAIAWLWPVLEDEASGEEILRLFTNRATETAGAATFTTGYGEGAYLIMHSDRRTDGVILDAMVREAPESDLVPKVVAGLLGNQTRGRWNNAHENAFILLALNEYFDTFESVTPDFVARIWLGDVYAGEHEYRGRTTDRALTEVAMTELVAAGDTDLIVAKDGPGRLYYRLGLRYAPDDLDLDPLDRGFVVTRTYEAVDDDGDVWRDDDGTWHIRAGAEVRVRLTMVADSRRTHVALVDPLPAGLEALNPALAVVGDIPPDDEIDDDIGFGGRGLGLDSFGLVDVSYVWWRQWYEHQNLRDDRTEAFTSLLFGGTYDYDYVARATTPGVFVVPPTKAEEIYAPETFGRSGSDVVVVEES